MIGQGKHGRTYKVKISELLDRLKANREEHQEIVEEAQAAFRKQAIAQLDRMLTAAKAGSRIPMQVGLTVPTKHLSEFDNAIGLMEMTQRADEVFIEITADEYERFVRNIWDWTERFRRSNSAYSDKVIGAAPE